LQAAEKRFGGQYLSSAAYDTIVSRDTLGTLPNGELTFLFLRNVTAPPEALQQGYKSLRGLPFNRVQSSLRKTALRGSKGGELVLGWLDDSRTGPRPAAHTWTHPTFYSFVLVPLLARFGELLQQYLPRTWATQVLIARHNGECLIGAELRSLVGVELFRVLGHCRQEPWIIADAPEPLFSTVTINKNAIFRSHTDDKNGVGMVCITTFGDFIGGALCFPRLRVAFDIQPGDVLIADTNHEQHGNVAPMAGTRISVVAYLRTCRA
jgi:hypothetical protein